MFTKMKFNAFFKSIGILALCIIGGYALYKAPTSIQNIFRVITDYMTLGLLFVGYLWACFGKNVKARLIVALYLGGMLLMYIAYQLGLEALKFYVSAFGFNIFTSLSAVALYMCNRK